MRTVIMVVGLLAVLCSYVATYQISLDPASFTNDLNSLDDPHRVKRELENFEDEFPTSEDQREVEEPGFWDRMVKVALKLFSRFIEWLNT